MIKVKAGQEKSAYKELQTKSEIKDVYRLFGEYSFFLVMQAEGQTRLNELMLDIQEEDYVIKTKPFMLMNSDKN